MTFQILEHKTINYSDDRGTIRDIFSHQPKEHCTIITSVQGSIRGNHYHEHTTQYTYIIEGMMVMLSQQVDVDGQLMGDSESVELKSGDLVTHSPYEAHAFKATQDCIFLVFADGIRGGKKYEDDVIRLVEPLIVD
jgi:mannose-6-phosphate isomerase-like protein (cupin superfamily)